jgi:hypothetical protein
MRIEAQADITVAQRVQQIIANRQYWPFDEPRLWLERPHCGLHAKLGLGWIIRRQGVEEGEEPGPKTRDFRAL